MKKKFLEKLGPKFEARYNKVGKLGLFGLGVSTICHSALFGIPLGVGITGTLLLHELGHVVALKKFGINIHRMVFYPFMGAKVSYYVDSRLEMLNAAIVSLAGPASAFIGASSFLAASLFDTQLGLSPDTSVTCARLAEFGFFMNAINLTPISFLDGGQVFSHFPSYYKLAPAIASGFLYHFDYFTAFFHYPLVAYCVYSIVKANWHSLEHNCSAFGWFQFDGEHMKVLALYFILVSSLTVAWVYAANVHDEKQKLLSPKRTKRFKISYKGHEISWDRN